LASILSCTNVVLEYFQGIGTFGSITDRYIGGKMTCPVEAIDEPNSGCLGAVGVGVKMNLFNAYSR
jgi:hypothetical protein